MDLNHQIRAFSSVDDYQSQLDAINDAFVEARDEIEYAQEDSETVYFEEGLKTAQKAVGEAMGKYNALLDSLSEQERGKLQRSMGMKMEQLKAELYTVEQTHA
ncbi:g1914 [Coccomyxa viridis]|uniref:G1914 protein n=1 Tax=Coccomyxa viridis TaxID=1274662 RepID=A0ABP1FJ54_9CHLO